MAGTNVNFDKFEIATKQRKSNAIFFFLYDITMPFTYLSPYTGYEDDIFEVISSLNVPKLCGKNTTICEKSFKKLNSEEFTELVFSKSGAQL